MHKQYSCLVQVKASKRLGSGQLESDNTHEHALKLINIKCKHEQDIIHHEHKYRGGYVDFVSTTCMNMCQVKPLESYGGYRQPQLIHELFKHTKQNVQSLAHTNLLGTAGRYRIQEGIVDPCGITFGFNGLDAQVFPLSTSEGQQRTGKRPTRERQQS